MGDDLKNSVVFKRILAWIIDWNLCGIPSLIYSMLFHEQFKRPSFSDFLLIMLFVALILLYPVSFVFRDVIFNGRSIGKRIFGLHIIDKNTGKPASVYQRIIRNLFFFIFYIDGVILLATKESIGDTAVNTAVIKQ